MGWGLFVFQNFVAALGGDVGAAEECPMDTFAIKNSVPKIEFHGKKMHPLKTFMEAALGMCAVFFSYCLQAVTVCSSRETHWRLG